MIFVLVLLAIFYFLIKAIFQRDTELIINLLSVAAPMLIIVACLWLWGSGYTHWSMSLLSFSLGLWIGYKLVFWRHFGRRMTEDEAEKARLWLFGRKQ